ncbi:aminotransferase class IV [Actinoplanes sp. NPDC023714]|uniref:aminotransferase class IV n=1 Tax=Actinoplanes sp. NPDC023714 TaxID=3154322 RepID=UPI00340EAD7E
MTHVEINGAPASLEVVHRAATWNYGHYTSMQVRGRAVAGLDDHLRRLRLGSATLFPEAAVPGDIPELIRHALRDLADASVRVAVLPRGDLRSADVMVSVSDPVPDAPKPPLRVRGITYERELPQLKHMATMGLTYHVLAAKSDGFDDVLFHGRDGLVREGSVWNAVFLDGDGTVVWPAAPMLEGITMQVLKCNLPSSARPLTRADVAGMRGAATTNSHNPAQPIAAIDGVEFPDTAKLTALLRDAWSRAAWDPLDR